MYNLWLDLDTETLVSHKLVVCGQLLDVLDYIRITLITLLRHAICRKIPLPNYI